jgi:phosphohistidine phosphatase
MDLFILRHGKAGKPSEGHDDSTRALTAEGRAEIRQIAQWMKQKKFRFDCIATSPMARAFETAVIVAKALDRKDRLETWDELKPGGDTDTVCYHAVQYGNSASLLLVGHEPLLSVLTGRIVTSGGAASISFAKGGCAKIRNFAFDKTPSGELRWLLTPLQMISMHQPA